MSRMPPPSCTGIDDRLQDALDRGGIDRLAGEGAVEIDDVEVLEALRLERLRLRRRIAVEHGRARHVALLEAHAEAVLEVDGGKQDHGALSRHARAGRLTASTSGNWRSARKPSRWLFSGWNWVPTMVSRPTMAVTGPP